MKQAWTIEYTGIADGKHYTEHHPWGGIWTTEAQAERHVQKEGHVVEATLTDLNTIIEWLDEGIVREAYMGVGAATLQKLRAIMQNKRRVKGNDNSNQSKQK